MDRKESRQDRRARHGIRKFLGMKSKRKRKEGSCSINRLLFIMLVVGTWLTRTLQLVSLTAVAVSAVLPFFLVGDDNVFDEADELHMTSPRRGLSGDSYRGNAASAFRMPSATTMPTGVNTMPTGVNTVPPTVPSPLAGPAYEMSDRA